MKLMSNDELNNNEVGKKKNSTRLFFFLSVLKFLSCYEVKTVEKR